MDYYGYYYQEPSFFGPAFEEGYRELLNDEDIDSSSNEQPSQERNFPKSVFFIIGNEFCERFTFYGIRACLSIYLTNQLNMEQSTATSIFHSFLVVCYFTPLLGSMLADGYLGKFRTIFYLSIIYALGSIVLSLSATPPLQFPILPMSMVGLFLIALGTGGIKPCVSALGADQFKNDQIKQRERFFFIFYFSINSGSLISTFLTPILKEDVKCFGNDSCYPLAFGVPAVLMIISVILFIAGKSRYSISLPKDNIIINVSKCIGHAIMRRCRRQRETRDHWLDYADDEYDAKFRSDIKAALRVMFLFLPLPFFWALFDQQGSRWTFQAQDLDGRLFGSYEIIAEQMQMVNPLLILIFIPVFEMGVYPLFTKCNICTKPLPRMFIGGMLAALAFVIGGVLQLAIEAEFPSKPLEGFADISFINNGPCDLWVETINGDPFPLNITLENDPFYKKIMNASIGMAQEIPVQVTVIGGVPCVGIPVTNFSITMSNGNAIIVAFVFRKDTHKLEMYQAAKLLEKPAHGDSSLRLVYNLDVPISEIILKKEKSKTSCTFNINFTMAGITSDGLSDTSKSDYCYTTPGIYHLLLPIDGKLKDTGETFHPENGGQYDFNINANDLAKKQISVNNYTEVAANDLSMLYQIPQYVIITWGEIMFSISGLAFSYSQAPSSMKSVLQAAWLLAIGFGNIIVIIISEARFFAKDSNEYFLYAVLMALVMFLFAFMCMRYVYVSIDHEGNVIYPEEPADRRNSNSSLDSESTAAAISDGAEYDDTPVLVL